MATSNRKVSSTEFLVILVNYLRRTGPSYSAPLNGIGRTLGLSKRAGEMNIAILRQDGMVAIVPGPNNKPFVTVTINGYNLADSASGRSNGSAPIFTDCNIVNSNVTGRDNNGTQTVNVSMDLVRLQKALESIGERLSELELNADEDAAVRSEIRSIIQDISSNKVNIQSAKGRIHKIGTALATSANLAQVGSLLIQLWPFLGIR